MPNFHINLQIDNDKKTSLTRCYTTELPDLLLWQIEHILQRDIPKMITHTNHNWHWSHSFELSEQVSDEDVGKITGLLRSNGYKDVEYDGRRYASLEWRNYCKLRNKC